MLLGANHSLWALPAWRREVVEGMGAGCPLMYDPALNSTRPDDSCPPKSGAGQHTLFREAGAYWQAN